MSNDASKKLLISPRFQFLCDLTENHRLASFMPCLSDLFPGGVAGLCRHSHELLFLSSGAAKLLRIPAQGLIPGLPFPSPFSDIGGDLRRSILEDVRRQLRDNRRFQLCFSYKEGSAGPQLRLDGCIARSPEWGEYILCILYDITAPSRSCIQLHQTGKLDGLTGLYERQATEELFASCLRREGTGENHALFLIDIDNFQSANKDLGRAAMDEILRSFGEVLRSAFRGDDLIGRVGDDEFLVLMKNVPSQTIVRKRARDICRMVSQLFMEFEFPPGSCSIGIVFGRLGLATPEENWSNADLALYCAKAKGKNNWNIWEYDPDAGKAFESGGDAGRGSDLDN